MGARGQGHGHAVEAPDAHDLLVEVDLADEVGAEAGRHDGDLLVAGLAQDGAAQVLEDGELLLVADFGADVVPQALGAQAELDGHRHHGVAVHNALADGAACDLDDEGSGDLGVLLAGGGVDAALVA